MKAPRKKWATSFNQVPALFIRRAADQRAAHGPRVGAGFNDGKHTGSAASKRQGADQQAGTLPSWPPKPPRQNVEMHQRGARCRPRR